MAQQSPGKKSTFLRARSLRSVVAFLVFFFYWTLVQYLSRRKEGDCPLNPLRSGPSARPDVVPAFRHQDADTTGSYCPGSFSAPPGGWTYPVVSGDVRRYPFQTPSHRRHQLMWPPTNSPPAHLQSLQEVRPPPLTTYAYSSAGLLLCQPVPKPADKAKNVIPAAAKRREPAPPKTSICVPR